MEKVLNICINVVRSYIEAQENEADLREKFSREYTWKEIQQLKFEIPEKLFENIITEKETVTSIFCDYRAPTLIFDLAPHFCSFSTCSCW